MAIIITFEAIPESHCKPEDDLEFVILKGNKRRYFIKRNHGR